MLRKEVFQQINTIHSQITQLTDQKDGVISSLEMYKNESIQSITNEKIEQKNQFETFKVQKNAEIKNALDITKTEIETFTIENKNKIDALLSERKTQFANLMQKFEADFSESQKSKHNQYNVLKNEIAGLLPTASAVGISKAFYGEKKINKLLIILYTITFIFTIGVIVYFPIYLHRQGLIDGFFKLSEVSMDPQTFFVSFLRLGALEFPLIWLANMLSRKIQQHQRIHEEYVHKYTASMTFVGMSKEAKENTKLFGEDHIKKLTNGFVDTVYMNPSSTLDKNIKTDNPLEKIQNLVKDVGIDTLKQYIDHISKDKQ